MPQQSKSQKETVGRVMHEFKHGELKTRGAGPKVKSRKQAIAIALNEAGATNQKTPKKNSQTLKKTKAKERDGQTAQGQKEGKRAQDKTMAAASGSARKTSGTASGKTSGKERSKSQLYAEARKRDIPGRSKMTKAALERALHA